MIVLKGNLAPSHLRKTKNYKAIVQLTTMIDNNIRETMNHPPGVTAHETVCLVQLFFTCGF